MRQAHKEGKHVEEGLKRPLDAREVQRHMAITRAEVQRCPEGPRAYRQPLETLRLTLQPFAISTALPQTSAQVASQ